MWVCSLLETGCGWWFVSWFCNETDFLSPTPWRSTSLAHGNLLFCEGLPLSLENAWWSISLPQRSVVTRIESEMLVDLSRENKNLHFRVKPQSLSFLWYASQSNLMWLPGLRDDLMVRVVFYKKRNGQGDCIFFFSSLLKWQCWEAICLEAAHVFLHELLEQRKLLVTKST